MREIQPPRILPIHTELMAAMPGGNVRVAAGLDIGIDANSDGNATASCRDAAGGFGDKQVEFRGRFDVEEQDACGGVAAPAGAAGGCVVERLANFFARLADAGKNNSPAGHPNALQAIELTAAHHIETAAKARQELQNRQIRVGFDRVT